MIDPVDRNWPIYAVGNLRMLRRHNLSERISQLGSD